MGLDIRLPMGLMFMVIGPIILATGLLTQTPINTYSGACMSTFGVSMLSLSYRGRRAVRRERLDAHSKPESVKE